MELTKSFIDSNAAGQKSNLVKATEGSTTRILKLLILCRCMWLNEISSGYFEQPAVI